MKKVITKSLILAFIITMLFSTLPTTVSAADESSNSREVEVTVKTGIKANSKTNSSVWFEFVYAADDFHFKTDNINTKDKGYLSNGSKNTYTFGIYNDPLKQVIIHHDGSDEWYPEYIELDGVTYWIQKWIHNTEYVIDITPETVVPDNNPTRIKIKTGKECPYESICVAAFICEKGNPANIITKYEKDLNNTYTYPIEPNTEQEFILNDFPKGEVSYFDVYISAVQNSADKWDIEWVELEGYNKITVDYEFKGTHNGHARFFPTSEYVRKRLEIRVGEPGTKGDISVNYKFKDQTETDFFILNDSVYGGDFSKNSIMTFDLYIPNKEIESITIRKNYQISPDELYVQSISFDGVLHEVHEPLDKNKPTYTIDKDIPKPTETSTGTHESNGNYMQPNLKPMISNSGSVFSELGIATIIVLAAGLIAIIILVICLVKRKKKKADEESAE